jgi:hypothetical protein
MSTPRRARTRSLRRAIRNTVVAGCIALAGGSAGIAFGPLLAITVAAAVIVVGAIGTAAAIALQAILSRRDTRSPFDRLILILCLILGRSPRTYLPPTQNGPASRPSTRQEP